MDTQNAGGAAEEPLPLQKENLPAASAGWVFRERYQATVLFSLLLVLRLVYAFRFRFDTDEPQHLHVIWGWANGLLQYRDVFDNHGPLFHLLCVPLFRALGERPDILIPMRLAMIPFLVISLWCVYRLGAALFSARIGIWAAIFTGLYPEFFFTSTEFRTDDLWLVIWMLTLVTAISPNFSVKRAFATGLLLGLAFAVTVKSGLMVGALGSAALAILGWQWVAGKEINGREVLTRAAAALLGLLVVPLALLLFFASYGALKEFLYCNITHNLVPKTQNWEDIGAHLLWLPVFSIIALGTLAFFKRRDFRPLVLRRIFLVLTAGFYFSALKSLFPTLSRQDDLPFIPLACLIATFLLARAGSAFALSPKLTAHLVGIVPASLALVEAFLIVIQAPFWHDQTKGSIAMVAGVLRSTKKTDFVMDATGETIFRPRPYYYALEAFTRARMDRGLIKDDIARHLIISQTKVVRPQELTKLAQKFIRENYVDVGYDLSMLGKVLKLDPSGESSRSIEFKIEIPARYVIVGVSNAAVTGTLDGESLAGSHVLSRGLHVLSTDGANKRLALFWADAFENGFSPFGKAEPL